MLNNEWKCKNQIFLLCTYILHQYSTLYHTHYLMETSMLCITFHDTCRTCTCTWIYIGIFIGVCSFAGPGVWIRWKNEVDRLAEVTYFFLTTVAGKSLKQSYMYWIFGYEYYTHFTCVIVEYYFVILGYQTVGEEYVNIIQIDTHRKNIPSKLVLKLYVS